ncbi:GAF domain-containing protein [Sulfidibacter corallicola]|uniref:GAF domain-containing protein n=1 Tax=Sulfidibacter corallicola TaxID=2818388 RepID=A0A8A4TU05_SULCO|nr:HD family phosphohydrolase [Sulfidibacter corallicola]QTD50015.1 GAF domain-containing protein [Sulfidibacter corallicola]
MEIGLRKRIERLELLHRVAIALSAEQDKDRLVEMILEEAKKLCNADAGTLYLRTQDDHLRFAILRTESLGLSLGGSTGKPIDLPPIPLYDPESGKPNHRNIASYSALVKQSINIPDAYHHQGFDFSGTKAFDSHNGYRSTSFLTIPLVNYEGLVVGVLQLINATDPQSGTVIAFSRELQDFVETLAYQAAIALDNQLLLDGQKALMESFIKLIATAIDAKSPYTGGHCERVPVITEMLAKAACDCSEGPLSEFHMDEKDWYEMRIAAWMHDCGKVVTPVHVMDKATKLETIFDRIDMVRARFEVLRRDAELAYLRALHAREGDPDSLRAAYDAELKRLDDDLAFLEKANEGGEFLAKEVQDRIREIGNRPYREGGELRTLLTKEEIENLCIAKGTLTPEERIVINGHMVQTIKMLEALPWPRYLRRVPEIAGGHHEKMDGSGYPKGLYAGDMSIPARIMAIADVFEALTAQDRPYKKGKTLSETMRIMGFMKRDNHLDPDLFNLFVRSGIYREYGNRYLPQELIDEIDETALLAIEPKPFELPSKDERFKRRDSFLPEYCF